MGTSGNIVNPQNERFWKNGKKFSGISEIVERNLNPGSEVIVTPLPIDNIDVFNEVPLKTTVILVNEKPGQLMYLT